MNQLTHRDRGLRTLLPLGVAILAISAAVLPVPPGMVERVYSTRFYAALQPRLTAFSNAFTFALIDVALVGVIAAWIGLSARDFIRLRAIWQVGSRIAVRTAVWAAAGYLLFLIGWGFNYRRVPLAEALAFDATRVTPDAVTRAAELSVQQLNALYESSRARTGPPLQTRTEVTAEALNRAIADVGRRHVLVPGRPKKTLLDLYFRRAGVDGMTDPFFLETLVATDLLPFERPMIVAHEWAHLAGVADEGEANFVGWLACRRAAPPARYSGWLFLYAELMPALAPRERASIAATLGPGPRADLRAIRDRVARQVNPRLSAVGWAVYDSYLKANRIEAGAASYGEVVRLVLGARLASGSDPLSP